MALGEVIKDDQPKTDNEKRYSKQRAENSVEPRTLVLSKVMFIDLIRHIDENDGSASTVFFDQSRRQELIVKT
jgi:hypothetical protein